MRNFVPSIYFKPSYPKLNRTLQLYYFQKNLLKLKIVKSRDEFFFKSYWSAALVIFLKNNLDIIPLTIEKTIKIGRAVIGYRWEETFCSQLKRTCLVNVYDNIRYVYEYVEKRFIHIIFLYLLVYLAFAWNNLGFVAWLSVRCVTLR